MRGNSVPLTDSIVIALSKLVDDAQEQSKREPSHSNLTYLFKRAGLIHLDPKEQGQSVGKAKRVRAVLSSSLEDDYHKGEKLVKLLIDNIKGFGGFRKESSNFVGQESIDNAISAFKSEGYSLSKEGSLLPTVFDHFSDKERTEVLMSYVKRARKGSLDSALLVGTSKDLLEAVAKHVVQVKWGHDNYERTFPMLLGQAFSALEMKTSINDNEKVTPIQRYESSLYQLGCSVNTLRNKEGTGHGRIFLPTINNEVAQNVTQSIAIISDYMLTKLADEIKKK